MVSAYHTDCTILVSLVHTELVHSTKDVHMTNFLNNIPVDSDQMLQNVTSYHVLNYSQTCLKGCLKSKEVFMYLYSAKSCFKQSLFSFPSGACLTQTQA